MIHMRIDEQIKKLCVCNNISLSELARRLDKSPQAFSQKLNRGSFSLNDLDEIAMVLGCKIECRFVLMNGEIIELTK